MDFAALKTEVGDRGFDYLSSSRLGQFVNDAMHELDEIVPWPYREATASGAAPLAIEDLGIIQQVINTTGNSTLEPRSYQWLVSGGANLSAEGSPTYYYVSWLSGTPELTTWPTNADTITVHHWRIGPDLSLSTDVPLAPPRFHGIIVDIAVRMALIDSDNFSAAQSLQTEIERKTARMMNALLGGQQLQSPDSGHVFYSEDF